MFIKNNRLIVGLLIFVFISLKANLGLACNCAIKTEIWNSEKGISRLDSSNYKNDFYQLANFYQAQSNPIFCSSATALAIKNALFYGAIPSQKSAEITKPNGEIIAYNLYSSQEEFLNEETDKIKAREVIKFQKAHLIKNRDGTISKNFDPGLNLQDFAKILKIHKIKSKIYHQKNSDEASLASFREILKKILSDKKHFLIANFDGKIFNHKTGGHISPVVAYDEVSDSALILDVALHKNQWYWVGVVDLVKAMNSLDGDNYRGYLVVWK